MGIGKNTREDILNLQLVRGCHVEVYEMPFVALGLFCFKVWLKDDKGDYSMYFTVPKMVGDVPRISMFQRFLTSHVIASFFFITHADRADLYARHKH